jgi:hypothetical protein
VHSLRIRSLARFRRRSHADRELNSLEGLTEACQALGAGFEALDDMERPGPGVVTRNGARWLAKARRRARRKRALRWARRLLGYLVLALAVVIA